MMAGMDDVWLPPSDSNTYHLSVAAASASVAVNLVAAVATDATSTPFSQISQLPYVELLFSSSQKGRLIFGGSGVGSPAAKGIAIMADVAYPIPVYAGSAYFRFYNEDASTAAKVSWTNPNRA